jgi:hypothetical protein
MTATFLAVLLASSAAEAGGYGAPTASVAFNEQGATVLRGGRGGWVIDQRWVIGGEGRSSRGSFGPGEGISYGALFFEHIFLTEGPIHPTVDVSFGGGEIWQDHRAAAALVSTAGAHLDFDMSSWIRLSLGGSYLLTLPEGTQQGSWRIGRPCLDMMVKFGSF